MLELPRAPPALWTAGASEEVGFSILANHGGGYSYRLCRDTGDPSALTEECFQKGHLSFASPFQRVVDRAGRTVANFTATRLSNGTHPEGSVWTRNPFPQEAELGPKIPTLPRAYGRGPFAYNLVDTLAVPAHLPPGRYVLSWRWDAEQTKFLHVPAFASPRRLTPRRAGKSGPTAETWWSGAQHRPRQPRRPPRPSAGGPRSD